MDFVFVKSIVSMLFFLNLMVRWIIVYSILKVLGRFNNVILFCVSCREGLLFDARNDLMVLRFLIIIFI